MIFKRVGIPLLLYLIIYWVISICLIVFFVSFSIAVLFYFKVDSFNFNWVSEFSYALNKSMPSGTVLGIGIWIKAKLSERKDKKTSDR